MDSVPPAIAGSPPPSVTPELGRAGTRFTVEFDTTKALLGAPEVWGQLGDQHALQLEVDPAASSATHFVFHYEATGTEPERTYSILTKLIDQGGNVADGLLIGSFALDFTAPKLVSARANPASAKFGDVLVYTVSVSEPLPDGPMLRVIENGVERSGFLARRTEVETATSFVFTKEIDSALDGAYQVQLSLVDFAGNTNAPISGEGFFIDSTEPRIEDLVVSPPRVGKVGTLTATFDIDEALADGAVTVQVGSLPMVCGARQTNSPNYSCIHLIDGTETPDGQEEFKTVLVRAIDGAGNSATVSGNVVFDFAAPSIVIASPSAASAKQGDLLTYTISVSEKLQGPLGRPELVVRLGGTAQPDFFSNVVSQTDTSIVFAKSIGPGLDGVYTVELTVTDEAGNTRGPVAGAGFSIDSTPPSISNLAVTPQRIGKSGQVTASFDVSELLPAGALAVNLGTRPMVCGSRQASSPHYSCTYTMTGGELATEVEKVETVLVSAMDLAGNRATDSGSVVFDFDPPGISFATVQYSAAATNPLGAAVTKAAVGTTIRLVLSADELLDASATPAVSATNGTSSLSFTLEALSDRNATFSALVPAGSSDSPEVYVPSISNWTDVAGNSTVATFSSPQIALRTTQPSLLVKQSQVQYLRSPWGNAAAETLDGGFTVPSGAYYALAPADSLSGASTLPADTFQLSGGVPIERVRVWSDPSLDRTLLGDLEPLTGGVWPRKSLSAVDVATVYLTALDEAGNESPPVKLSNAEWVATSRAALFANSPHRLEMTTFVQEALEQSPNVTRPLTAVDATIAGADTTALLALSDVTWRERGGSAARPSARKGHAAAFDSARGRLVIFGGTSSTGAYLRDTWEFDGQAWIDVTPVTPSPSARIHFGMAYDSRRGRVVLFGGFAAGSAMQDTWEWDGSRWREVTPTGLKPSARSSHAMAYDSRRGRVVVFGGFDPTNRHETWEWDGQSWFDVTPAGMKPPGRALAGMAYDPVRGRIVLFGGFDGANFGENCKQDTWEWDGQSWVEVTPTGAMPSARYAQLAYDGKTRRILLFGGGSGTGTVYQDTWTWDGLTWTSLSTAGAIPSVRSQQAMAYDGARQRLVLFGGGTGILGSIYWDTWEWNGQAWIDLSAKPSARYDHAMTYDSARSRVVLFGGVDATGKKQDLWEWDGLSWVDLTPATLKPSARAAHAIVYDSARGRVVLFGGSDPNWRQDIWEWDGVSWLDVTPGGVKPAPREKHAMAYDSVRGRVVLMGGFDGVSAPYGYATDTWEWNGATRKWADLTPTGGQPGTRDEHAMAFDTSRSRVVLFGGFSGVLGGTLQDVWEWDGVSWLEVTATGLGPVARERHPMVFDSVRARSVVVGGFNGSPRNDTWQWNGQTRTWVNAPASGIGPSLREQHAMAYDRARGDVIVFGGKAGSTYYNDTWELDGDPARQPAVQLVASASSAGFGGLVDLRVRARCAGASAPFTSASTGATLHGWSNGADGDLPGWRSLRSNIADVNSTASSTWSLDWSAGSPAAAKSYFSERDASLGFQCRPLGGAGFSGQEAQVAVDYMEVRVKYLAP